MTLVFNYKYCVMFYDYDEKIILIEKNDFDGF